jgi:hypothetical protein
MSCSLVLIAKEVNQVNYSLKPKNSEDTADTTGYTLFFRFKETEENITAPLLETTAFKITETVAESTGYFIVNLEGVVESEYEGFYYYEIEANDGVNPPLFFEIGTLLIKPALKQA